MRDEITKKGAQRVLKELAGDQKAWHLFLKKVEENGKGWVQIGLMLRKHSDAGVSTELDDSIIVALRNAPESVLGELSEGELQNYCTVMLNEGSPYRDIKTTIQAAHVLEKKLQRISLKRLKRKAEVCENFVKKSESDAINWFHN